MFLEDTLDFRTLGHEHHSQSTDNMFQRVSELFVNIWTNVNDTFSSALRVTQPLKSVAVPETHLATFECEVSHFNVASRWLKDGLELEMSEKFSIVVSGKIHQLRVMNVSSTDAGEYTFICGSEHVSATLLVNCKLLFFLFFLRLL